MKTEHMLREIQEVFKLWEIPYEPGEHQVSLTTFAEAENYACYASIMTIDKKNLPIRESILWLLSEGYTKERDEMLEWLKHLSLEVDIQSIADFKNFWFHESYAMHLILDEYKKPYDEMDCIQIYRDDYESLHIGQTRSRYFLAYAYLHA